MVLAAVNQHGEALEFASEEMKGDKEVVLAAVNRDILGYALNFASKEMQGDPQGHPQEIPWNSQGHPKAIQRNYEEIHRQSQHILKQAQRASERSERARGASTCFLLLWFLKHWPGPANPSNLNPVRLRSLVFPLPFDLLAFSLCVLVCTPCPK